MGLLVILGGTQFVSGVAMGRRWIIRLLVFQVSIVEDGFELERLFDRKLLELL